MFVYVCVCKQYACEGEGGNRMLTNRMEVERNLKQKKIKSKKIC